MSKIFNDADVSWGAAQSAKEATLTLQGGGEHLIVQQLDITAGRPITTLYDLTSLKVYYVGGRSQTQFVLNRVCGPKGLIKSFYTNYGDICKAESNDIAFKIPEGCEAGGTTLKSKYCVLTQVQFSMNVQNYVIAENCQIQGTTTEYS
jgi:hypothetical protein